ncbi:MAG TPA: TadE family protein [Caulobacteraceae bacterium]|nr:TadE family protein [Caulobacteraceae bacterium]
MRSRRGSAAVEFAIISPIMILILAGLYEVGSAFQSLTAVNELASQYAISWADCSDNPAGTCNTEIGLYSPTAAISNVAPQLTAANVTLKMFQVTMSGTTPTVTYSYPSSSTLNATQTAAAQASLTSGQTGVIVTVNYTYTVSVFPVALSGVIPASFPMSFTVVQLKA